jgi:hypothetical protein
MTAKTCTTCKGKQGTTTFDDVCGAMVFDLCEACGGTGEDRMAPAKTDPDMVSKALTGKRGPNSALFSRPRTGETL